MPRELLVHAAMPLNRKSGNAARNGGTYGNAAKKKGRQCREKCWMYAAMPLKIRAAMPREMLDACGNAAKKKGGNAAKKKGGNGVSR